MKNKISAGLGLIVVLSIFLFMGCNEQKSETSQDQEPLVLKTYKVPFGVAKEIYDDLNGLLSRKLEEPTIGNVRISSDGQIMVAAPESFQWGVAEYIEKMNNNNLGPTPVAEVHYWIVAGRKSKAPSKLDEFKAIKPALETIQNNQGNMEFKVLDHIATTSSGQSSMSKLSGTFISIRQMLYAYHDGSVIIEPRIRWNGGKGWSTRGELDTKITVKSGELIVLGQLSQKFRGFPIFTPLKDGEKHVETVNVYYIISADTKK